MLRVKAGSIDPDSPAEEQYNPFPPELPLESEQIDDEERERRRKLVVRILRNREALRAKYGPLDVSTDELKHLARAEERY